MTGLALALWLALPAAAQVSSGGLGDLSNAINRELWPYLAVAVLAVLSLEWLVYVRR